MISEVKQAVYVMVPNFSLPSLHYPSVIVKLVRMTIMRGRQQGFPSKVALGRLHTVICSNRLVIDYTINIFFAIYITAFMLSTLASMRLSYIALTFPPSRSPFR